MLNSSYNKDDVIFLLKDLTNIIPSTSLEEKERLIASGVNYSEMITDEEPVSDEINKVFEEMLQAEKANIAEYVGVISEGIMKKTSSPILVSLARAGTPIGILVKRYIKFKYGKVVPHYTISIIRGKGIDTNALNYILEHEKNAKERIVFLDGWTGKKSITHQLKESIEAFDSSISSDLVVLADPAKSSNPAKGTSKCSSCNACLTPYTT